MDSKVGSSVRQQSQEDLAAAVEAVAAESTIEVTLGALLLGLDSTGGESSMRKGAEEDPGKRSEMRSYAEALLGEPTWKDLAPDVRAKLMQQRLKLVKYLFFERAEARAAAAHKARLARHDLVSRIRKRNSSRKKPLKSQGAVRANAADGGLKLAERAQHEEAWGAEEALARAEEAFGGAVRAEEALAEAGGAVRAEEALAEAGGAVAETHVAGGAGGAVAQAEGAWGAEEAVAEAEGAVSDMNSEGIYSFTQEESVNELEMRLEMMKIRPEMQVTFHKAILTAMLDIKEKLAKKKTDEDTLLLLLLLLKGMSNRLGQGGYEKKNEIDKGKSSIEACLGSNERTDTTMVESDIKPAADPSATNSKTIQVETLPQMVKDFPDSMRSTPAIQGHTPTLGSDKLLIQPADPSATNSMTRLGQYSVQDDLDHDEMAQKTADKEMIKKTAYEEMTDEEAEDFANYRSYWEATWSKTCGSFEYMTALSSMQFTCYPPRCSPSNVSITETMQIFSIKLAEISGGLGWPLSVYGVVVVRDVVDRNRNFLFYCDRNNSQELTQNDPFLRLIGPSRAVVYDRVNFEIQLRVKGTTMSQDKALISEGRSCHPMFCKGASTVCFKNCFCKIELCMQLVRRTTQATILGVQVVNSEQWPFKYGARVACSSLPGEIHVTEDNQVTYVTYPASGELVMVDSKAGVKLNGGDGYLQLSRNVVSVEDQGRLDVDIQAYSKSGHIAAQCVVKFPPRFSKITRKHCSLRGVKVVITVAWSRVANDKHHVMSKSALVQA